MVILFLRPVWIVRPMEQHRDRRGRAQYYRCCFFVGNSVYLLFVNLQRLFISTGCGRVSNIKFNWGGGGGGGGGELYYYLARWGRREGEREER